MIGSNGDVEIGTLAGETWIGNLSLPRESFSSHRSFKIVNIFMLFVFALVYDFIGFFYIERTREWTHNEICRPHAKVKSFAIAPLCSKMTMAPK
jgi:hypothetical protein